MVDVGIEDPSLATSQGVPVTANQGHQLSEP